ncbi:hypothetical protein [Sphingomonas sp. DT-51]|uniref:hypothetical protein n=1 Tax=Sphingomonas sp. DT-51 TaxID=3396165 RepID=UPI003F53F82C
MNRADAETVAANVGVDEGEADLEAARSSGERAGADLSHQGVECPYGHENFEMRTAWFNGFSEGRVKSKKA